jgi:hypothetical protein
LKGFIKTTIREFLNENIIEWYYNNKGVSDKLTRPYDGIIYTFTDNLEDILKTNMLKIGDWGYISFTRNPNLNYGKYRISFDIDRLNKDYKLKDYVYDAGWDQDLQGEELEKAINDIKNEEEIIAFEPIENLDKYIISYGNINT